MDRRAYDIEIIVNGRRLTKLIIDPHYEEKHGESVNDEIIFELVKMLDGGFYKVEMEDDDGFQYFSDDSMELNRKTYKLIWLLHGDEIFIGVVNCYRRK